MNAAMRHLAVRFWLTALAGGALGILFLPWWQRLVGVDWLIVPSVVMTLGCFAGAGWVMNRIGLGFLQRNVAEAASWERAGMSTESETAFDKAMATFDSFWISPLLRRRKFQWFSGVMARFHMGRNPESPLARSRVAAHLRQFPHDAAVAEPWLENLLAHERHLPQEHEAVERIGLRLQKNRRIQRLLMQFYMVNGRTDFDALQTYRRVWHTQSPLPAETVHELSRLLHGDHVLTPWALQVFLAAHETGDKTAVEGIAAAVRWLPVTEESRAHLTAAKELLDGLDRPLPEQAAIARFKPDRSVPVASHGRPPKSGATGTRPRDRQTMSRRLGRLYSRGTSWVARAKKWLAALPVRQALPAMAIVLIIALAAVAGWGLYHRPASNPPPQTRHAVAQEPVITDPFTIQVAAYLQRDDAQKVVDQLIQAGLDAFWTHAASAHRSWYQVKVSHFASREAAQAYGRGLKSKGLIDDFYVANYEHARRNAAKP
jgi:cell division septation protein DedD